MKIRVTMSEDEFSEFTEWRKNKAASEKALQEVGEELKKLAGLAVKALEEYGEADKPVYKIRSQEDAAALAAAAVDIFE